MIARMRTGGRVPAAFRRIDRPQAIGLAVVMAVVASVGWIGTPFLLAVAVAFQLGVGGLGAVALIGPARPGFGLARYTTLALAGVAATLAGRLIPGGVSLLFIPLLAVLLWSIAWLELRGALDPTERWMLDLGLSAVVFATAAGIGGLFGEDAWPPPFALVALVAFVLALRLAEARGRFGADAVGQALLHALGVVQTAAAAVLLHLPGLVGQAVVAVVFYAWSGAADALDGGSSARSVAVEFGSLAVLALIVALLMRQS